MRYFLIFSFLFISSTVTKADDSIPPTSERQIAALPTHPIGKRLGPITTDDYLFSPGAEQRIEASILSLFSPIERDTLPQEALAQKTATPLRADSPVFVPEPPRVLNVIYNGHIQAFNYDSPQQATVFGCDENILTHPENTPFQRTMPDGSTYSFENRFLGYGYGIYGSYTPYMYVNFKQQSASDFWLNWIPAADDGTMPTLSVSCAGGTSIYIAYGDTSSVMVGGVQKTLRFIGYNTATHMGKISIQ